MKKPNKSGLPARKDWLGWLRYNRDYGQSLLRKDGEIHGTIFAFHNRDGIHLHIVGFRDPEHKALVYKFLALKAVAVDAEAVGMIAEAWVLEPETIPGESPAEHRKRALEGIMPSQSERRIEVVSTTLIHRDEADHLQSHAALDELLRNDQAKITGFRAILSEAEIAKPRPVTPGDGYFADLLSAEPPTKEQVVSAKRLLSEMGPGIMDYLGIG